MLELLLVVLIVAVIVAGISVLVLRGLGTVPVLLGSLRSAGGEVRPVALTRAVAPPDAASLSHLLRTHEWEPREATPELARMSAHGVHEGSLYPGCALCCCDPGAVDAIVSVIADFLGAAARRSAAAEEDEVRLAGAAGASVLPLGVPPQNLAQVRDLLDAVAGRCRRTTGTSRCWERGWMAPTSEWQADRWCGACMARVLLDLLDERPEHGHSLPVAPQPSFDLLGAAASPCNAVAEDGARPDGGEDGDPLAPLPSGAPHPDTPHLMTASSQVDPLRPCGEDTPSAAPHDDASAAEGVSQSLPLT